MIFFNSSLSRLIHEGTLIYPFIPAGSTFIHNGLRTRKLQINLGFRGSQQGHFGLNFSHLGPNFPSSLTSSPTFQGTGCSIANPLRPFNCSSTNDYSSASKDISPRDQMPFRGVAWERTCEGLCARTPTIPIRGRSRADLLREADGVPWTLSTTHICLYIKNWIWSLKPWVEISLPATLS